MITLIFGAIIFCTDFVFYILIKERLYLLSLIFIFNILSFLFVFYLNLQKKSYIVDSSGIYFNKKKKIIFHDSKITKFKLSKNNCYCFLLDENENLIVKIQIKHFSHEELQVLFSFLNRFEKCN